MDCLWIAARHISVSRASRIVSALNSENAAELIEFARTHSLRETDFEVARLRPGARPAGRLKPVSEDVVRLQAGVSNRVAAMLKRAEALLASKKQSPVDLNEVLEHAVGEYLQRHDPVEKARRNAGKNSVQQSGRVGKRALTAEQKHKVFARDQGRCTHVDSAGARCEADRWLDIHHIVPVSRGGTNAPENLTTLCGFHHDLAHQLSFDLLRERFVPYQA